MKLPKSLRIGSMKYTVEPMTTEQYQLANAVGLCDKAQNSIHIHMDLCETKLWSTLLHESLHGMIEEVAMPINDQEEELFVSHLERILCSFIRDNPKFIDDLQEVLRG